MSYTPLPVTVPVNPSGRPRPPSGTFASRPIEVNIVPESNSLMAAILPSRLDYHSLTYKLLLSVVVMYLISCFLVPPFGYAQPTALSLLRIGSVSTEYMQCAAVGYIHELRRLIVPLFLSPSILPLLFSLYILYLFVPPMEQLHGVNNTAKIYFASGLVSNLCLASFGVYISVGLAGACYGLIGSRIASAVIDWAGMGSEQRFNTKRDLGRLIVMLIIFELIATNMISFVGHLSGLAAGAALTFILSNPSTPTELKRTKWARIGMVVGILAATAALYYPVVISFWDFRQYCLELERIY